MKGSLIGAMLIVAGGCEATQATAPAEPPVPPEIVFHVCAEAWPRTDFSRNGKLIVDDHKERFAAAVTMWGLSSEEKTYVEKQCGEFARKINERLGEIRFDIETGKSLGRVKD